MSRGRSPRLPRQHERGAGSRLSCRAGGERLRWRQVAAARRCQGPAALFLYIGGAVRSAARGADVAGRRGESLAATCRRCHQAPLVLSFRAATAHEEGRYQWQLAPGSCLRQVAAVGARGPRRGGPLGGRSLAARVSLFVPLRSCTGFPQSPWIWGERILGRHWCTLRSLCCGSRVLWDLIRAKGRAVAAFIVVCAMKNVVGSGTASTTAGERLSWQLLVLALAERLTRQP